MVAITFLFTSLMVAASASLHPDDRYFASLLKRQAPGTPSYNCHDNCGTAITLSRQPNVCSNSAFTNNYANCLKCSGPDNYDIWKMYGRTLSNAGASCGLSTEPAAGKQEDVGPAVHASGSASGAAASATASGIGAVTSAAGTSSAALSVSRSVVPSSITAAPVPSGNVTASRSLSAPVQQSTNAGANVGAVGVIGAVVLGAMAAL